MNDRLKDAITQFVGATFITLVAGFLIMVVFNLIIGWLKLTIPPIGWQDVVICALALGWIYGFYALRRKR